MSEKIEACVWCGNPKPIVWQIGLDDKYQALCVGHRYEDIEGCDARGPVRRNETEAITAWNRVALAPRRAAERAVAAFQRNCGVVVSDEIAHAIVEEACRETRKGSDG